MVYVVWILKVKGWFLYLCYFEKWFWRFWIFIFILVYVIGFNTVEVILGGKVGEFLWKGGVLYFFLICVVFLFFIILRGLGRIYFGIWGGRGWEGWCWVLRSMEFLGCGDFFWFFKGFCVEGVLGLESVFFGLGGVWLGGDEEGGGFNGFVVSCFGGVVSCE